MAAVLAFRSSVGEPPTLPPSERLSAHPVRNGVSGSAQRDYAEQHQEQPQEGTGDGENPLPGMPKLVVRRPPFPTVYRAPRDAERPVTTGGPLTFVLRTALAHHSCDERS